MSTYPILDNKPIDQWKVTELKEELKKRKLKYSGKKEELIRVLDQALRVERENEERENAEREQAERENAEREQAEREIAEREQAEREIAEREQAERENVEREQAERENSEREKAEKENSEREKAEKENTENNVNSGTNNDIQQVEVDVETVQVNVKKGGGVEVKVDINSSAAALAEGEDQAVDINNDIKDNDAALGQGKSEVRDESVSDATVSESVVTELAPSGQELLKSETQGETEDSKPQLENEGLKPLHRDDVLDKSAPDYQVSETQGQTEDSKPQLENEGLKPPHRDDLLDKSAPDYQVSEVSPNLGSQVKSDSISTDSVSINEKIELKDNIIDNVKLELDVIKPEMVEPSSSYVVPVDGESHAMDVEEPLENKSSLQEKDDKSVANADLDKKNDSAEVGYSEKLNLDRSSGDDSMEEDVLDSKQIDSKDSSEEARDRIDDSEVPVVKEESLVVGDGLSADKKDVQVENKTRPVGPAEKRKINDQEVGGGEPLKRQRRWNTETLKIPEQPSSNLTPSSTPRDTLQPPTSKRSFSRSDSSVSEEAVKERVVPPSPKSPTNSLRIDHFVRPFTLKAVQELLGKTGTFGDFWMDHIKTHCYVTYSSVEEAIETRNALYNIQWPPNNGGRPLIAEFVDPQEVKMKLEAPKMPVAPVSTGPATALATPAAQPQPSPRQPISRQQLPPPPNLPPPSPISNQDPARERFTLPPPPPLPEKIEPPIVTLDDLFRKTKATPRIYYLPLSEEQVAAKVQSRNRNTKQ